MELPSNMKAVQLPKYNTDFIIALRSLQVVQLPIPQPTSSQVLIKVDASTCNPSDIYFMQGTYSIKKHIPIIPGLEGTGKVVSAGSSSLAQQLIGKQVSFVSITDLDGAWAEYAVAEASMCIPHLVDLPTDQAAGMIINPLTALGLIKEAKKINSKAIIISAAASQLGGMLRSLAKREGIESINIVRSDEHVNQLKAKGVKHVLNSSNEDFEYDLHESANKYEATTALDAVSGRMTGSILNAMPPQSQCIIYGTLSNESISNLNPRGMISGNKQIKTFTLFNWFQNVDETTKNESVYQIQQMIAKGEISTHVQMKVKFEELGKGLMQYFFHQSKGKLIILP